MRLSKRQAIAIKTRIDIARSYAEEQFHDAYDRAWKLYEGGREDRENPAAYDRMRINVLMPAVEIQIAATAFRTPSFVLTPETRASGEAMPASRDALAYEYRMSDAQGSAIDALRERLVSGVGLQTVAWLFTTEDAQGHEETRTYGERPEVIGEEEPEAAGLIAEEGASSFAVQERPVNLDEPLEPEDHSGYDEPVPERLVRDDRVVTRSISPKEFWIDPECGRDHEKALYLGWTERRPLSEVKRDPKLSNVRTLKGSAEHLRGWMGEEFQKVSSEKLPDDLKRVDLYHYYEKERRLHVVMSDESDKEHLVEPWPHDYDRYPVRVMRYHGRPSRFWPESPMLQAEHPQREIELCREVLATHVRQSQPKLQYAGRLNESQRKSLQSARQLVVVELDTEEKIGEVPIPPVQPEIFSSEMKAREDIQLILGLSEYQTLAPPTKRLTTTEVQAIQSGGNLRGATLRDEFEAHVSGVAADILALLQQNSVRTRSLPIFDDYGAAQGFRDYSKEDIQGEFIVQVRVGSMKPPSAESSLENLGFLMQAFTNAAQGIMVGNQAGINLRELLRDVLADNPLVKDINRIVPEGAGPGTPLPGAAAPGNPPSVLPGISGTIPAANGQAALPPASADTGALPAELIPLLLELMTNGAGNTG